MLKTKTSRGRPKGTGIDDSDRIARIVEMLRSDPNLKPTTAIRVMGFSDPSAIRRLRDKYKQFTAATDLRSVPQPRLVTNRVPGQDQAAKQAANSRLQG